MTPLTLPPTLYELRSGFLFLKVYVQPGGRKCEILGFHDGALKVRIASPPIDGKANELLISYLAQLLKVPKRFLGLSSGHKSKNKVIEIAQAHSSIAIDELKKLVRG